MLRLCRAGFFVEFGLMVSVAERLFFNLEAKNVCQDEPRDSIGWLTLNFELLNPAIVARKEVE